MNIVVSILAAAVNLATIFGTPGPTPGPTPQACKISVSKSPIVANGVDSATITLLDAAGNSVTTPQKYMVYGETGEAKVYPNLTLPKTVVSTLPGQWRMNLISPGFAGCSATITAQ